jgi:aspartate racemase
MLVPEEEERVKVHRIIYDELCQEKINDYSRSIVIKIISGLIKLGAEGIVLACTELPLLIRTSDIPVPLFDTTYLHAEAAVKLALAE